MGALLVPGTGPPFEEPFPSRPRAHSGVGDPRLTTGFFPTAGVETGGLATATARRFVFRRLGLFRLEVTVRAIRRGLLALALGASGLDTVGLDTVGLATAFSSCSSAAV